MQLAAKPDCWIVVGAESENASLVAEVQKIGCEAKNYEAQPYLLALSAPSASCVQVGEAQKIELLAADPVGHLVMKAVQGEQDPAEDLVSATAKSIKIFNGFYMTW